MDTESLATGAVEKAIAQTDYLAPYINSKDKEPVWDGGIYAYHHASQYHSNDDLVGRVPIQVKGHITANPDKEEVSFPIKIDDLRNYLVEGGTIFFVVYFDTDGNNEKIYYKCLLPFELKRILCEADEQASKTIHLRPFPTDKKEKSNIFLNFIRDRDQQRACIRFDMVTLEDIAKTGRIPELTIGYTCVDGSNTSIFENMITHGMYLYAKLDFGVVLPVEHFENITMAGARIEKPVMVGNTQYYESYEKIYKPNKVVELCFGKNTVLTLYRKENRQTLNFSLKGTLSERIKDLRFIIAAFEYGGFQVGESFFSYSDAIPNDLARFDLESRKKVLSVLEKVKSVLDKMDVQGDLELDNISNSDLKNLDLLVAAVADGQLVPLPDTGSPFGYFNINNLKLIICAIKDSTTGKYKIYNFFDAPIVLRCPDIEGIEHSCPLCAILSKEMLFNTCNINCTKIIEELRSAENSPFFSDIVVKLLLEVLLAYDEASQKKPILLDLADEIINVIKKRNLDVPSEITRLNELQIQKRKRDLTVNECEELVRIAESNEYDEESIIGAYLLLDNHMAAKLHFEKIDADRQNRFRSFPIYRFWSH